MAKIKVLITVKTYPSISRKYDELVCTAGIDKEGNWIRIYPVPFRKLDYAKRFAKYQWVEIDLVRNTSDFRKESYRPRDIDAHDFVVFLDKVDTNKNWKLRKELVLKNVYANMTELIAEAQNKQIGTSLATFKPTKILDFYAEPCEREWDKKQIAAMQQQNLWSDQKFEIVRKIPYRFKYEFEDNAGRVSKMMNEDWELCALYWKGMKKFSNDEEKACEYVRSQYMDNFVKNKDLYFFLGTTKVHHYTGRNPFIIIGTFYPKKELPNAQMSFQF